MKAKANNKLLVATNTNNEWWNFASALIEEWCRRQISDAKGTANQCFSNANPWNGAVQCQ